MSELVIETASTTMSPVPPIDWESPVPVPEQMAAELRGELAAGRYPVGSYLPSVDELRARWDVSAATITRTMAILREAGLVAYRRRRGHLVLRLPK